MEYFKEKKFPFQPTLYVLKRERAGKGREKNSREYERNKSINDRNNS